MSHRPPVGRIEFGSSRFSKKSLNLIKKRLMYKDNHEDLPLWAGLFRSKGKFHLLKVAT